MPGWAHQLDIDRVVEEVIDTKVTAVAMLDLLSQGDIHDDLLASQ